MNKSTVVNPNALAIANVNSLAGYADRLGTRPEKVARFLMVCDLNDADLADLCVIREKQGTNFMTLARLVKMGLTIPEVDAALEIRATLGQVNGFTVSLTTLAKFSKTFPEVDLTQGEELIADCVKAGNGKYPDSTIKRFLMIARQNPGISLEAALDLVVTGHFPRAFYPFGSEDLPDEDREEEERS